MEWNGGGERQWQQRDDQKPTLNACLLNIVAQQKCANKLNVVF